MIVLGHRALLAVALAEPLSDWLLETVGRHGGVVAGPTHQTARALAAVTGLQGAGEIDAEAAEDAVSALLTLPLQAHAPDAAAVRRARELAPATGLLDALHVAVAERLDVPLLVTGAAREVPSQAWCEVLAPPAWLVGRG